ncbi:MAG: hypothetical protein K0Q49_668 [Haloplasmataceae bacterium]|jgi:hypothetical protein|nr:hypothetical protein [Haloplasmataceae bacterium]
MNYFDYLNPDKTCVLSLNGEIIYESYENGVKPFVKYIYYHGKPDENAILIDKIIGVAIANLAIYCNLKTVYAKLISKPALELLKEHKIDVHYEDLVDHILRKDRSDICPLEKKVLSANSPDEAYVFLKEIVINNNPIHIK